MGLIPNPLHHPNYNRHRLFLDYAQFLAYIEPQNLLSDKIHGEYGKNFSAITLNQEITEFQNSSDHLYKANTLVLIGVGSNDIYSNNCLKDPLQCISTSTAIMVNQIKRLCRMGFSHFLLATPTYALDAPGLIHYLQTVLTLSKPKAISSFSYKTTCVSTITLNYSFNTPFLMLKLLCYMPQSLRKSSLKCFRPQLKPPATTMATVMKSITGK